MRAGKRIAACLAALVAAAPAFADYKDSYSRGLEAVRDGDWSEVRRRMQEAMAEQSTPAVRVRLYGQRWEPYVPQYYLGLAAFKQGDCAGALQQWRSGANAGVIADVPALKAAQDRDTAACDARVAQQTPSKPPVTEAPRPATPTTPGDVPQEPSREPPRAPPDKPKPEPPKPEPPKSDVPKPEPAKPEPPKPVATPTAQRVPAPLLDAYRAWLAGRYADVARINPDSYTEPRAKAQALLVRAAARQIQAELDANAELLDAARADVRAVRAIDPRLAPDAAMFSPRFRAFYAATR